MRIARRIRTVKPELFSHPGLYRAELASGLPVRLAFVNLFTVACREGRFPADPLVLGLHLLPLDCLEGRARVGDLLDVLERGGWIERYEVGGELYGRIVNWGAHQRPPKDEGPGPYPPPQGAAARPGAGPQVAPGAGGGDEAGAAPPPAPPVNAGNRNRESSPSPVDGSSLQGGPAAASDAPALALAFVRAFGRQATPGELWKLGAVAKTRGLAWALRAIETAAGNGARAGAAYVAAMADRQDGRPVGDPGIPQEPGLPSGAPEEADAPPARPQCLDGAESCPRCDKVAPCNTYTVDGRTCTDGLMFTTDEALAVWEWRRYERDKRGPGADGGNPGKDAGRNRPTLRRRSVAGGPDGGNPGGPEAGAA